jgi:hypothetical protein
MRPNVLLVNPPIHDFSAYDFWLKPYGLLRVAGYLRHQVDYLVFDYLDREHPFLPDEMRQKTDQWGRGPFYSTRLPQPELYAEIPHPYRRYGLPREDFQTFLADYGPFDVALIQTVMT